MQKTTLTLETLLPILPKVRKPSRYIGNELHSIHKDLSTVDLKVGLGFPDLYEIGMSNLGIQILYHVLNSRVDIACERFFAPNVDLEKELRENNLPLFSLESFTPLSSFDLLGFSLGHELGYTNLLTILDLSGIPIRRKDRNSSHPLVFAGGPSTINPSPLEEFVDFFVIGDGEEVVLEIADTILKNRGKSREELFQKLGEIKGIYLPALQNRTQKTFVKDLENSPYPTKPIVPFLSTVHDRGVVEIMRGCKRACKFCSAFCGYKPVRERSPEKIIYLAKEIIKNTGFQELSLVSLSSSDYSQIEYVARTLAKEFENQRVNIALPSMRVDNLSVKLLKDIQKVRPTSITVAPEAGSQRLRDLIRKDLTEDQILGGVESAFAEGITSIKLYFMIGLPTETEEDLLELADLVKKVKAIGSKYSHRSEVTAALSTFIPKPHTFFEREGMVQFEEIYAKHNLLKSLIRGRGLSLNWHDAKTSVLEGIISRGDQKLADVIESAWRAGSRFESWGEHFHFELWEKAFEDNGIDYKKYLAEKSSNEELTWKNIIL